MAWRAATTWVIGEQLAIEHATTTLPEYQVPYTPGGHQIRDVSERQPVVTSYESPQLFLLPLDQVP